MKPLTSEYRADVDVIQGAAWHEQIAAFKDANLYQFWNEGSGQRVSRLLLKKRDEVVAAAEVRLFTVPVVRGGIAYIFWGPVWRRHPGVADLEVFRQAIRALINEYVVHRRMVLRINPRLFLERDQDQECLNILSDEGFARVGHHSVKRSLVMSVTPGLEELRKGFDKKWRNCLSKAERSGLEIACGTSLELFDEFVGVYDRMLQRKQFEPTADIQKHRRIQQALPDRLKLGIVVARHEGRPCAGAIYSALGDTAVYLFGATDESGMRTSAAYLVQWTVIQRLKEFNVERYDLNGINPEANPGTYHFKRGLAGKTSPEVTFVGQVQALRASLTNHCLLVIDKLRSQMRSARERSAAARA